MFKTRGGQDGLVFEIPTQGRKTQNSLWIPPGISSSPNRDGFSLYNVQTLFSKRSLAKSFHRDLLAVVVVDAWTIFQDPWCDTLEDIIYHYLRYLLCNSCPILYESTHVCIRIKLSYRSYLEGLHCKLVSSFSHWSYVYVCTSFS